MPIPDFLQGLGIANQARESIDRQRVQDTEAEDALRNRRMLQRVIQMAYLHELKKESDAAEAASFKSAIPKPAPLKSAPGMEGALGSGILPGARGVTGITPGTPGLGLNKFSGIYDDAQATNGLPTFVMEALQQVQQGGVDETAAERMARELFWHSRRFVNGGQVDVNGIPMGVPFQDGGQVGEVLPELTPEELEALDVDAFLKRRLEDGEIFGAGPVKAEILPVTYADLGPQVVANPTAMYGRLYNALYDVPSLMNRAGFGPGAGSQALQDAEMAYMLSLGGGGGGGESAGAGAGTGTGEATSGGGDGGSAPADSGGLGGGISPGVSSEGAPGMGDGLGSGISADATGAAGIGDSSSGVGDGGVGDSGDSDGWRDGGMIDRWGQKSTYVPSTPQEKQQQPRYKSILEYILQWSEPEPAPKKKSPYKDMGSAVRGADGGRVGLYGFMKNNMTPKEKKRKSAVKMKGGGMVRGPGTGTSDSVPATIGGRTPALLSNGEYVLSADTVRAVGKDKLDALQAKYHKPVR